MRQCLLRGPDEEWYCVPTSLRARFAEMRKDVFRDDGISWQDFDEVFDRYRLLDDISCYSFTSWTCMD